MKRQKSFNLSERQIIIIIVVVIYLKKTTHSNILEEKFCFHAGKSFSDVRRPCAILANSRSFFKELPPSEKAAGGRRTSLLG